jgi:hypothetical protein
MPKNSLQSRTRKRKLTVFSRQHEQEMVNTVGSQGDLLPEAVKQSHELGNQMELEQKLKKAMFRNF